MGERHYFSKTPDPHKYKRYSFVTTERGVLLRVDTASGIFSYRQLDKGTEIFLRFIKLPREPARVLDLGAGYGIIALMLGKLLPRSQVVAIEVNERAYKFCKKNVETNRLDNVECVLGDFFEYRPEEPFDAVYSNPPIKSGRKKVLALFDDLVPALISPGGFFQTVFKTALGAKFYKRYILAHEKWELIEEKIKSGYRVFTLFPSG
ncbi:MAG: class I SAM-dependent methyltransferase [Promethearchaeota archaeon]